MQEDFPRRLQRLRERRGMSRVALGGLCGKSKNMIAIYERGEAEPTSSVVALLAENLDVSADYLLCLKENF